MLTYPVEVLAPCPISDQYTKILLILNLKIGNLDPFPCSFSQPKSR